jgi:hypothetical protein
VLSGWTVIFPQLLCILYVLSSILGISLASDTIGGVA